MRDLDTPKSALRLARELAMRNLGFSGLYEDKCDFIKCCDKLGMKQLEDLREKLLKCKPDTLGTDHKFSLECIDSHIKTLLFNWYMLLKEETIEWQNGTIFLTDTTFSSSAQRRRERLLQTFRLKRGK